MRPYDVVLWDLDGTIMDSAEGVFLSFEHTFAEMGLVAPTRTELRRFLGPPLLSTFGEILGFSPEDTIRAMEIYREKYHEEGAFGGTPFSGVAELVAETRANGIHTALATSKAETAARIVTNHFHLDGLFDVYATASDDESRKTKGEVVEFALTAFRDRGIATDRVVLVGDRIHDVEGAAEHGVDCVLVEWGYGTPEEFAAATASVATIEDLRRFLEV